jgi:hypothetical protein
MGSGEIELADMLLVDLAVFFRERSLAHICLPPGFDCYGPLTGPQDFDIEHGCSEETDAAYDSWPIMIRWEAMQGAQAIHLRCLTFNDVDLREYFLEPGGSSASPIGHGSILYRWSKK